jgi:hypothetical protein
MWISLISVPNKQPWHWSKSGFVTLEQSFLKQQSFVTALRDGAF